MCANLRHFSKILTPDEILPGIRIACVISLVTNFKPSSHLVSIRIKHTRFEIAIKIALAVIYFAYFTAQLSYKFYVCASFPSFSSTQLVDGAPGLASDIIHERAGNKALSMDKRYNGKHIFALLPPLSWVNPQPPAYSSELPVYQLHLFIPPVLIPAQRGPPLS